MNAELEWMTDENVQACSVGASNICRRQEPSSFPGHCMEELIIDARDMCLFPRLLHLRHYHPWRVFHLKTDLRSPQLVTLTLYSRYVCIQTTLSAHSNNEMPLVVFLTLLICVAYSATFSNPNVIDSFAKLTKADVASKLEGLTETFAKLTAINTKPEGSKILLGHEAPPTSPRIETLQSEVRVLPEMTASS
ncbi:uncharacterized protein UDID_19326 [Ustilago sp. UG-2017a]|nr:uncharacterized protein UDID_19326 [Ustilago sp. UG-2017a]